MSDIMLKLLVGIGIGLFLLLTPVVYFAVRLQITKRLPTDKRVLKLANNIASFGLYLSNVRVEVTGRELLPNEDGFLVVANHQSNYDPLIIQALNKKLAYVGKIELKGVPIVDGMFQVTKGLFIDRKDLRASVKTIVETSKRLSEGINFCIFPEGTRSKSREMLPFKAGSLKAATKANAPIVPIVIKDAYLIKERFPRRSVVHLEVIPTIYPSEYEGIKETQLVLEIENRIKTAKEKG